VTIATLILITKQKEAPMDQDTHYMTRDFLQNQVAQLTDELNTVKKFKEDLISSSNKVHDLLGRTQESLREWTKDQLASGSITQSQALELAHIGDFTLVTCYDVTIAVEHTFTIELEAGDDIDDVLTSIDFSADSYHTTLDNVDYNVIEVNYEECD